MEGSTRGGGTLQLPTHVCSQARRRGMCFLSDAQPVCGGPVLRVWQRILRSCLRGTRVVGAGQCASCSRRVGGMTEICRTQDRYIGRNS
jgi:hypothetical protein